MPAPRTTESLAALRAGAVSEEKATARTLHAVESLIASWKKIKREETPPEFQQGRAQMAEHSIGLLLGVPGPRVKEALENGWL